MLTHRLPTGVLIVTVHSVIARPQYELDLNNNIHSAIKFSTESGVTWPSVGLYPSYLAISWLVPLHEIDSRCDEAHGGVAVVVAEPASTDKSGGTS